MEKNIGQKLALYPTPANLQVSANWDIIGDCVKMGKAYGETLK